MAIASAPFTVENLPWEEVVKQRYDLGIFASGYEERCTAIARELDPRSVERRLVLGFKDRQKAQPRLANDRFWLAKWVEAIPEYHGEYCAGYDAMHAIANENVRRILVDYSSMSRVWYASVLNWLRIVPRSFEVVIDLVYSAGEYPDSHYEPLLVDTISLVPGFDGLRSAERPNFLGLGLGFDPISALSVIERLMPDNVVAFVASPSINDAYVVHALKMNAPIISAYTDDGTVVHAPLLNVRSSFAVMAEALAGFMQTHDVTLVPLGPKPHVLASLLVAMRFPGVTCLRVSGRRPLEENIRASSARAATRIVFEPNVVVAS